MYRKELKSPPTGEKLRFTSWYRLLCLSLTFIAFTTSNEVFGQPSTKDDATLVGPATRFGSGYYWYKIQPRDSWTSSSYPDPVNSKVPTTFYFIGDQNGNKIERSMSKFYSYNNQWEGSVANKLIVDHPVAKPGQEYIGFYYMTSLDENNKTNDDMFRNWGLCYGSPWSTSNDKVLVSEPNQATNNLFYNLGTPKILFRCYDENWGYRTETYQYNYMKCYIGNQLTNVVNEGTRLYFCGGWDWDGNGGTLDGFYKCTNNGGIGAIVDEPVYWEFDVEFTNDNPNASVSRGQNGTLAYSVSNIPRFNGYSVDYLFGSYGTAQLGTNTSGSGRVGSGIDHKQAINLSYRSLSHTYWVLVDSVGYSNTRYNFSLPSTTTRNVQYSFYKTHDAISLPGCTYPVNVESAFTNGTSRTSSHGVCQMITAAATATVNSTFTATSATTQQAGRL